ncbi:MAG: sigma-54-dependent transcriptional regulator [Pirellulales bacterium]
MSHILVVDDEPAIGWSLRELLADEGHDVAVAGSVAEALASCGRAVPETVLLDVRLPGRDGIAALPDLRSAAAGAPVIVMTAFGDLDTAVRAIRAGAFDYLVKPFDLERVAAVVGRALADRAAGAIPASPAGDEPEGMRLVGSSPALQEVFKRIALVAGSDLPVLITGPEGSGKTLVARAIHAHGPRRDRPFLATSLAALAPTAIAGELFGRADGSPGLVALATGGTLLVEHIDAAPADVQARLLDVLETQDFADDRSAAPRRGDVRLLAATRVDLAAPSAAFRHDLAARLGTFTIALPGLAERPNDIEHLARGFLARHAAASGRRDLPAIGADFLAALAARDWPGNVRQLRAAVEHAAVVSRGGTLRPEHLPPVVTGPSRGGIEHAAGGMAAAVKEWAAAARSAFGGLEEPDLHDRTMQVVEAALLREALAHTGGNRTAAAKLLGLDRATLRTKLRHLGLDE